MKYYAEIVPFDVAKRLVKDGYPNMAYGSIYTEDGTHIGCAIHSHVRGIIYNAPTYAEVLYWLKDHSISVEVIKILDSEKRIGWVHCFGKEENWIDTDKSHEGSWKEVADWSISKALEILEEQK